MRTGRFEVGRYVELCMTSARPEVRAKCWIEQRRRCLHFEFKKIWRIPADLLKGLRVNIAELQAVGGPHHSGVHGLPGEAKLRSYGIAVAIESNGRSEARRVG